MSFISRIEAIRIISSIQSCIRPPSGEGSHLVQSCVCLIAIHSRCCSERVFCLYIVVDLRPSEHERFRSEGLQFSTVLYKAITSLASLPIRQSWEQEQDGMEGFTVSGRHQKTRHSLGAAEEAWMNF
jgi:hypothetical protein